MEAASAGLRMSQVTCLFSRQAHLVIGLLELMAIGDVSLYVTSYLCIFSLQYTSLTLDAALSHMLFLLFKKS